MGYSMSWMGVRGIDKDAVYSRLGLAPTGELQDRNNFWPCGRSGPNDWTLVILGRAGHRLLDPRALESLSSGCTIVACNIEEHVMFSSIGFWEEGRPIWSVRHAGDRSLDDLHVDGVPPAACSEIARKYRALQSAQSPAAKYRVDYIFEIPPVLARSMTSFKHDESGLDEFERLELRPAARPPAVRRWWPFAGKER